MCLDEVSGVVMIMWIKFKEFQRDERASMSILALFLLFGMMMVAGLGVDLARSEYQRTLLQTTIDRAVLSGGHPDQELDRKDVVLDYFRAAGIEGSITRDDILIEETDRGTSIGVNAKTWVDTPFLPGVDGWWLGVAGKAALPEPFIEVALVIDVSGSMRVGILGSPGHQLKPGEDSRMQAVIKAATKFSNLVLCNPNDETSSENCLENNGNVGVSLVPYGQSVTAGRKITSAYKRDKKEWESPCLAFRDADFEKAGVDPYSTPERAFQFVTQGEGWRTNTLWANSIGDWDDAENWPNNWGPRVSCINAQWREITPFEESASDLNQKLSVLRPFDGTAHAQGMKWGVNVLMPSFQPILQKLQSRGLVDQQFAGRPLDPNYRRVRKIIVFMTDGSNWQSYGLKKYAVRGWSPFWYNSYHDVVSVINNDNPPSKRYYWFRPSDRNEFRNDTSTTPYGNWSDHIYGQGGQRDCFKSRTSEYCTPKVAHADRYTDRLSWTKFWQMGFTLRMFDGFDGGSFRRYGQKQQRTASFNFLDNPVLHVYGDKDNNGIDDVNDRLLSQCTLAKENGIEVFAIEMIGDKPAAGILEQCASDGPGYYSKGDGANVGEIFKDIAIQVNELKLVE